MLNLTLTVPSPGERNHYSFVSGTVWVLADRTRDIPKLFVVHPVCPQLWDAGLTATCVREPMFELSR